jgi:adenylate cyclase
MQHGDIEAIGTWLIERALAGATETELLHGLCARCCEAGLDLSRGVALIDTLHPVHEGRAFRWRSDNIEESAVIEYGRSNEGEARATWESSPFYRLQTFGGSEIRRQILPDGPLEFPVLEEMRQLGHTDYIAMIHRFAGEGTIGEMDSLCSSFTTSRPGGFEDSDLVALRRLVPLLALAIKCVSLARIASTLVEVYLGRDAGDRVLAGRIQRGVAERIHAVLWYSDLRGYTSITDTAPPDEIIPLLNDYADAVISAIHEAGGEVLKLMGDGVLAIFRADDRAEACRRALRAQAQLRDRQIALNARRSTEGRPVSSVYLGLHIGDVFYGNIGSEDRLDFTVVGPAVNEASRIAAMCRSVDRSVVMSSEFVMATPEPERSKLVSVGRYALRGIGRAQELFTIDPETMAPP